ncbi:serine hydrolase domain-containing protein [Streptomyces sp. NPDC059445]|uniref:serine hydrolase domain-containing protein n=1 Tax=Streptomyces sp. NPDC059445 TaxID=3346832 RepID=UPI0036B6A6AE
MSARPLPQSPPAEQGVDASGITAFLDAVEAHPEIEPHSLMILRHGHLVASGWWAPYTPERLQLLYSLSKSFTSTAAGFAVAEGLLDLDRTVISYFPEFEADITDPRSRAMLVRHVAAMASGHLTETWADAMRTDRTEAVRGFLLIPPDRDPGTVFAYNQSATYTLASILQRETGLSLTEYLRPRLFDPLGIGETAWTRNRAGREIGFSGLHAATDAIARLGQLYLDDGVRDGRRLLPASWIAEATRAHVANDDGTPDGARSDWQQGYGLQFWRGRHGYRGDGAFGQYCVVLPEHDAVIATTAATDRMQELLDLMWRHLLPAFGTAPPRDASERDAALSRRLARLALPPVEAAPEPTEPLDTWAQEEFRPAGGVCAAQRSLTGVLVAEGEQGTRVTLAEGDRKLELRLEKTGWSVDPGPTPLAVSGGWTGPGTLRLDVIFLETPHRLTVECVLPGRTFTARWHTTPLHAPTLEFLRAPSRTPSTGPRKTPHHATPSAT